MQNQNNFYSDQLRSEYDPELLDINSRKRNVDRLYRALKLAGMWNSNMRILDVGGGTGLPLALMVGEFSYRVACDLRREPFQLARNIIPRPIMFVQSDGCYLPYRSKSFDFVMSLAVIGEFPDWQQAFKEMGRCVSENGVLYVTVANGPFLTKLYSLAGIFGIRVRESWKEYAKACLRLFKERPEKGLGALDTSEWEFIDITPFLIQSHFNWLAYLPPFLWRWGVKLFAPSYGFAWRKRPLGQVKLEK